MGDVMARIMAWLKDDGLNHDWDGEWNDEDLENARRHLDEVEARSPDTLRWLMFTQPSYQSRSEPDDTPAS